MDDARPLDFPAALSRTQRKLGQWRQRGRPGAWIPEELWREAAALARTYGTYRTARALRLNYYSLKKRLAAAAEPGRLAPQFVELLPGGMPAPHSECLIEVEEANGAKLRIQLPGPNLPDVAALLSGFRERRS